MSISQVCKQHKTITCWWDWKGAERDPSVISTQEPQCLKLYQIYSFGLNSHSLFLVCFFFFPRKIHPKLTSSQSSSIF